MKYNKKDLEDLIINKNLSYEDIGRLYGVTGSAVKKAAIRRNIVLPVRRKINELEHFNAGVNKSRIDLVDDNEFIHIINNNVGWKNILKAFGYNRYQGSSIHHKIYERCNKLGLSLQLIKSSPLFLTTKGELLASRANYQSYRSSIRKLAEEVYRKSGKGFECAICGYDKHVEIAHIKAVSDFDDSALISEINSKDNLIALCPNHHWEYDHGLLKL